MGSDLTGCYSTLLKSAEGRAVQSHLAGSKEGARYLNLLKGLVGEKQDRQHPKLKLVVDQVLDLWRSGQKVLIFCVRTNTAVRLSEIILERIGADLKKRRKRCLGGDEKFKALRARLTGRERDLVGLVLDRYLWSLAWNHGPEGRLDPKSFVLTDDELYDLARLWLKFRLKWDGERIDRVFLNRATEHLLACRLVKTRECAAHLLPDLEKVANEDWIAFPYGRSHRSKDQQEDTASYDERGCQTVFRTGNATNPPEDSVRQLAEIFRTTRENARARKQIPIIDSYGLGPNLWLGADPLEVWNNPPSKTSATLIEVHRNLWNLLISDQEAQVEKAPPDLEHPRTSVFKALRKVLLREAVLLRLLPDRADQEHAQFGSNLARLFFEDLKNQRESMADRVAVLLEDWGAASGYINDPQSARGAFLDATRLHDKGPVALVEGRVSNQARERIFTAFNTPLLPEVLICTAVGQEGIDLHRHCRHVIHYDLPWNPAVFEQRTGRTDRIGSKTERERKAARNPKDVVLDIGVPFLAGTYDERTFEELRQRAQTFEVLTGGDFAADHVEEDAAQSPYPSRGGASLVSLPIAMLSDLRVNLEVYLPPTSETKGRLAEPTVEPAPNAAAHGGQQEYSVEGDVKGD